MALVILSISVLLLRIEHETKQWLPMAALISIMTLAFIIFEKREKYAHLMSSKFEKVWVAAQIILFTLVGSQVNIYVAFKTGLLGIIVITIGLLAIQLELIFR